MKIKIFFVCIFLILSLTFVSSAEKGNCYGEVAQEQYEYCNLYRNEIGNSLYGTGKICRLTDTFNGVPIPCEELGISACTSQKGCSWNDTSFPKGEKGKSYCKYEKGGDVCKLYEDDPIKYYLTNDSLGGSTTLTEFSLNSIKISEENFYVPEADWEANLILNQSVQYKGYCGATLNEINFDEGYIIYETHCFPTGGSKSSGFSRFLEKIICLFSRKC